MSIIYLMVPFAILLGIGFLGAFIWATKNDQFEDLDTSALRILIDETTQEEEEKERNHHEPTSKK